MEKLEKGGGGATHSFAFHALFFCGVISLSRFALDSDLLWIPSAAVTVTVTVTMTLLMMHDDADLIAGVGG